MTPPNRPESAAPDRRVRLPDAPVLVAGFAEAAWLGEDGEIATLKPEAAAGRARAAAPMLCHALATARRLACDPFPAYDVLELYAFVRPASFAAPTPRGLAAALGLAPPHGLEDQAAALREVAARLLGELAARGAGRDPDAAEIAWTMARAGWRWGPAALAALGFAEGRPGPRRGVGLRVWERLPSWSEQAPEPPPGSAPVDPAEARARLAELLGEEAEPRPQQADYASAVSLAFRPRDEAEAPNLVLAEAGTGVGKTLGYLAPASLWAEKNHGPVWISTYTRNLQHQIDTELDRLFPEPGRKAARVVIRKGRENYLCLLNLDDAVRALAQRPQDTPAVGLMARWAARSRDGDMVGGDFPGWLADLLGRGRTLGLTDRRGECIYSACPHYGKCTIERSIRRARRAEIVVANHALVMIQAALGEDSALPAHIVFDEGHHVFDAADGAFAAHLTGLETQELRRWLLGAETARRGAGRVRGLKRRVEDLIADDPEGAEALDAVLGAAGALAGEGWQQRIANGQPRGPTEGFLFQVREQVYARSRDAEGPYSLETETRPPVPGLLEAADTLAAALDRLRRPMAALTRRLTTRLDDEAETLDSDTRRRIEATCRALERRGRHQLAAWRDMLAALKGERPPEVVDWLAVERIEGRELDLGFYRHWIDPTAPFAEVVLKGVQGAVVTSATLTDGSGDAESDWAAAEARSGAAHLPAPAVRAGVPSPFDYGAQTRVFIVTDLARDDPDQVAAATRELFLAAGGGALGLFTAISRLRAVYGRIARPLEQAGLPLYAQHVDRLDTATLVDIFRAEADSCLLGTDAVRDGVDVPGAALRLIVFDRVPWPRPDLRHRARRAVFGGRHYDDMLTRLKLKQAFGRLVRRADDHGVFVLLDARMPSRLLGAFPEGVPVARVGLAEAVAATRAFLEDAGG
ncbi:MAG: ATP-dependent DNA helicase [Rhodospirillales bacterium]|nr:ATP-dependent DNA helicase [Rhodospirillales bacterium]